MIMKTKPATFAHSSGHFLRPWRTGAMMLLTALLLAATSSTQAAKSVFERSKPHVNVGTIGRVELEQPLITFEFAAKVQTDGAGRASGVVQFTFMDGSVRNLAPVAGTVQLEGQQCLVFFLLLPYLRSGELDVTHPVTALAFQDFTARVGTVLWEFEGSGFEEGPLRSVSPTAGRPWRSRART
jgi:hypothetical protein